VFVNSDPIGVTDDVEAFITEARHARRVKAIPFDCSIVRCSHGICISSDMGVVVFPLIHLPDMVKLPQAILESQGTSVELWSAMCRHNIIEYVDAYELLEKRVAFKPEEIDRAIEIKDRFAFTHIAIHPSGFMGTSASSVPFPDHDQAPRVAYQAGMVKQAISTPASNQSERMDLLYGYDLWYPQKPMAETAIARASKMNEWPMGENLLIAIAPWGGWSQEDSIIRSRASIDRGSGRVTVYRIFKATSRKRGNNDMEYFEHPMFSDSHTPKCEGLRGGVNYDKIGYDGLPEEGTLVCNGDVLIGRVSHIVSSDEKDPDLVRLNRRDRSIILTCEPCETFVVDKVMVSLTKEGFKMCRVKIRSTRVPQEGDKISVRHPH
jgi:DNA-directed RNA polymerase beta subunit